MHILLIHQAFASLSEPGGTRHHELARHLVSLGHQVTVIASPVSYLTGTAQTPVGWAKQTMDDAGVTIIRTWTLPVLHRSFVMRVFAFLSFMLTSFVTGLGIRKVDLVWGTTPPIFQGLTAWLVARLKRVPFLFEVRDLWPAFAIAIGVLKNRTLIRLSLRLERFLYSHADTLVVNSPGFIAHVKSRGAKSVSLIPNGADPDMFDPSQAGTAFRKAYQLEGKTIVLYAGAHGLSNDLGVVLEAAELLHHIPDLVFVFLGDGKEKQGLLTQAQERHLSNVIFLPPIPKNEMSQAVASADACLAILKPIELYKTTYPNKVFDYMACARPVILAIDGVIRDLVQQADAGIFVTPGKPQALADGVQKLMSDPTRAKEMGLNGRSYIEKHFSRAGIAAQFNDVLLSMRRSHG